MTDNYLQVFWTTRNMDLNSMAAKNNKVKR